jgi:hypothetical protein
MRSNASHHRTESFEQYRQRMLDDTSRFIEWGLAHPDQVEWIPRHRVGQGDFPERLKNVFWSLLLTNPHSPD